MGEANLALTLRDLDPRVKYAKVDETAYNYKSDSKVQNSNWEKDCDTILRSTEGDKSEDGHKMREEEEEEEKKVTKGRGREKRKYSHR